MNNWTINKLKEFILCVECGLGVIIESIPIEFCFIIIYVL